MAIMSARVVPLTSGPSPLAKGPSVASRRKPLTLLRLVTREVAARVEAGNPGGGCHRGCASEAERPTSARRRRRTRDDTAESVALRPLRLVQAGQVGGEGCSLNVRRRPQSSAVDIDHASPSAWRPYRRLRW